MRPLAFALFLSSTYGCDSEPDCTPGKEACPCVDGQCLGKLSCVSKVCVDLSEVELAGKPPEPAAATAAAPPPEQEVELAPEPEPVTPARAVACENDSPGCERDPVTGCCIRGRSVPVAKTRRPSKPPAAEHEPAAKANDHRGGDPDIDCILDPSTCTSSKPASPSDLPEKLTSRDVKNGIQPHKADAKACGVKFGALSGEKITVKLSISGATGRVTSANATGNHKGTPLGNCVAAALGRAEFPRFAKPSLGVQYPIRL